MDETQTVIGLVSQAARFLASASLGVFAGGMLTEGCVLVPYWRSLKPSEFFAWYAANGQRLQGFFGPLTIVTTLLALAAGIGSLCEGHPARWLALLAAGISVAVVLTFFVYFGKANKSFAEGSLPVDEVA